MPKKLEPDLEQSGLRAEDRKLLEAILKTDGAEMITMIHDYYRDADRADRTPRPFLYFHMGLLAGVALRVLEAKATYARKPH